MLLFFFQDFAALWTKIAEQGIAISVLALILIFVIVLVVKGLPTWERIKTAELEVRKEEAKANVQIATALGGLGTALIQVGTTLESVAIEQRKATENVKVLQRATADENATTVQTLEGIIQIVDGAIERLDKFEETLTELKK